ncbi:MAG TPA: hypothetical protein VGJ78_20825 [Vicinamibacterales bacterium]|jgi:hypothetical protein
MPNRAARLFALVVALSLGYFIVGIPIQLTDCLQNIMTAQAPLSVLISNDPSAPRLNLLRPLLIGQLHVALLLAQGHFFAMFKTIHVVQLVASALLLVHLVRPDSWPRAIGSALGVAVLFGAHTFTGTIVEAFPINTFLTVVVGALLTASLVFSEPAAWKDTLVVALMVFCILTVETGALVLVIAVAGRMTGARGVSRGAIVALFVVLAAFAVYRVMLGVVAPGLGERPSAGFGFGVLDSQQLQAMFGARPWLFYAYNVASQMSTVLFGEPREGVWDFTNRALHGELLPHHTISVITSTGLTIAIAAFVVMRFPRWRTWTLEDDDRLVAVFFAVLAANAFISYPYVKDVIVSAAGAFFAVAGAVAVAHVLDSLDARRPASAVAIALLLAVLVAGWSVRTVGAGWNLRRYAAVVRSEWLDLDAWTVRNRVTLTTQNAAVARQLQQEALDRRVPPPAFLSPRAERYLLP